MKTAAEIDAQIIADQERRIARLIEELELARDHAGAVWERLCELFNPPDDDSWNELDIIEAAAEFIEQIPCTCTPEQGEDFDACPRCKVLGRSANTPHSR